MPEGSVDRFNAGASDYYATPVPPIKRVLDEMMRQEPNQFWDALRGKVLDPCAGGDNVRPMSYPYAMKEWVDPRDLTTVDIRPDSRAAIKADFFRWQPPHLFDLVISNPPFSTAIPFVERSMDFTKPGGFVVMLLRLNILGSQDRFAFWQANLPKYIFVHSRRMSFGGAPKGTDSIEYAHFVWQKGERVIDHLSYLRVIE